MDIILNTRFNNPNLPVVQLPGFYDDFSGGGGDYTGLGNTQEGRPWEYAGEPGWYQRTEGTATGAGLIGGLPRSRVAYVDGLSANGIIRARIDLDATADQRFGLLVRYTDLSNYIYLAQNSTADGIYIYQRQAGAITTLARADGSSLATGDILEARLYGDLIELWLKGGKLAETSSGHNVNATRHGFSNWNSGVEGTIANPRWDWIEFTA